MSRPLDSQYRLMSILETTSPKISLSFENTMLGSVFETRIPKEEKDNYKVGDYYTITVTRNPDGKEIQHAD